jgi:hypothetical protein
MSTRYILADIINGSIETFETKEQAQTAYDDIVAELLLGEEGCECASAEEAEQAVRDFYYIVAEGPDIVNREAEIYGNAEPFNDSWVSDSDIVNRETAIYGNASIAE